jgi:DNA-binding MarR family transcriptional regulator
MTTALQQTDIAAILGRARAHKLNATALQCLCEIDRRGPDTLTGLALAMDVSTTVMTGTADRLERLGYARRKPSKLDRRIYWLDITSAGQRALAAIL